jgi:hypothetical protein
MDGLPCRGGHSDRDIGSLPRWMIAAQGRLTARVEWKVVRRQKSKFSQTRGAVRKEGISFVAVGMR